MIRRGSRSLDQLVEVGGSGHCTAAAAAAAGMFDYNGRNIESKREQIEARPSRPNAISWHGRKETEKGREPVLEKEWEEERRRSRNRQKMKLLRRQTSTVAICFAGS